MFRHFDVQLASSKRCQLIIVSDIIEKSIHDSELLNGICIVSVPHTTAGLFINENADPDVASDILTVLDRLVPLKLDYRHIEGNSDAHIKSLLTGSSINVAIRDGKLVLGTWQGIFFAEFDGPRKRQLYIDILGDSNQ